MKKLLLASAVAVAFSGAANAVTYTVSSNITALQAYVGTSNVMTAEPGGYFSDLKFSGTANDVDNNGTIDSSNIAMTGEVGFQINGIVGRLTFNLGTGGYMAGVGTTFSSGALLLDVYDYSVGWQPFEIIDVSNNNLLFLAGQPGHANEGPQVTAGLLLAPGTHGLPGLWNGVVNGPGWNNAVGTLPISGTDVGLFLDGTVTLTEVPVPGAAWLFGSAVLGLAGTARGRRTRR